MIRYIALAEMCFSAGFLIHRWYYRGPYLKMVGIAFLIYMALVAYQIYTKLGSALTWRSPLAITAATVTLVAQVLYKDKEEN